MIHVIDLIETDDSTATTAKWSQICSAFAQCDGYISGQLLATFDQLHPLADFSLVSVCSWHDDQHWQQARQTIKHSAALQPVLNSMKATFTAFKGQLVNGGGFVAKPQQSSMVLVDVISVPTAKMDAYQAMWDRAKQFMESKPGYIGASLYRTLDDSQAIKFINLAEWSSVEQFYGALKTPEFFHIIDEFKNDFALYLTRRSICKVAVAEPA